MRNSFLLLPCDWRFLPKLGPLRLGARAIFYKHGGAFESTRFYRHATVTRGFVSPFGVATHKSETRPIADLTCCRAAFAAAVFAYHLSLQTGGWAGLARGYLGVDGFFILSGAVLAYAHPSLPLRWHSVRVFWLRRLARLYPLHLAMIALLAGLLGVAAALGFAPRDPGRFGARELALHLVLLQGWGLSARWAWNYPSWSISTEWAGYVAFPALWAGIRRVPFGAFVPPLAFAVLWLVDGGKGLNLSLSGTLARFFPEFIAGIGMGRADAVLPTRLTGRLLAGAGLALTACALAALGDAWVVAGLWVVLCGLRRAALRGERPVLAGLPGLVALGELSFAFYMSFAPVETVQSVVWRALGMTQAGWPLLFAVTSTALTAALASVAHVWIERPARRRLLVLIGS